MEEDSESTSQVVPQLAVLLREISATVVVTSVVASMARPRRGAHGCRKYQNQGGQR